MLNGTRPNQGQNIYVRRIMPYNMNKLLPLTINIFKENIYFCKFIPTSLPVWHRPGYEEENVWIDKLVSIMQNLTFPKYIFIAYLLCVLYGFRTSF
jgi:hypothetical protein